MIKKQIKNSILKFIEDRPNLYSFFKIFHPFLSNSYQGKTFSEKCSLLKKRFIQFKHGLPKTIAFEPISRCVFDCEYCILQKLRTWEKRRKDKLSFEEFKKIIDDIAWFTTDIGFSCGESLINPDICKMFAYARSKGIYTTLVSNGYLLNEKNIMNQILEDPPDKIVLAFESPEKEQYEEVRRITKDKKGDYERFLTNVKNLVQEKKKRNNKFPLIALQMVLTKKNIDQVDAFWDHVKTLGVDVGSIKPLGIWPEGDEEYDKKMVEEYLIPMSEHPISRHDIDENGNITFLRQPGQCPGVHHAVIASGGEILPCWYILVEADVMGNAIDNNFVDVWNSKEYTEYRDKMLNDWAHPLCHRCIGIGASKSRSK